VTRYLFTTLPTNDLGLLAQSLPIARELRARGHHITFCSPAKAPNKLITDSGFDNLLPRQPLYYLISGDVGIRRLSQLMVSPHLMRNVGILKSFIRHLSRHSTAEIWNIDHFMSLFGMGNDGFIRVMVDSLVKVIDACAPEVVVDFLNPFACIAAGASRTPLITVIQADMHPESQGLIWWKDAPSELPPSPVQATNRVLADYHLSPIEKIGDLVVGDLTLVLGMPELDPLPKTANVTYVGPILWQKQNEDLPEWIGDLNAEQPVIWLYPGNLQYVRGSSTWGDSGVVLEACIEALGNDTVQVVLTTGHHVLPERFDPLPANFRHEPYVPGLAMAERSDLLIHHGGYGSCQTGLYTGTPALMIPTFSERESNARRIADQGAGDYVVPTSDRSGRNKRVSAHDVRAKVFKILSDGSFTENARRIGEKMKAFGGALKAARLIEGLDDPAR
jgi:UDP:flavonoid glycosyltransferase YjiC (YdhE family)